MRTCCQLIIFVSLVSTEAHKIRHFILGPVDLKLMSLTTFQSKVMEFLKIIDCKKHINENYYAKLDIMETTFSVEQHKKIQED